MSARHLRLALSQTSDLYQNRRVDAVFDVRLRQQTTLVLIPLQLADNPLLIPCVWCCAACLPASLPLYLSFPAVAQ